jgi:hypothetical protein
MNHGPRVPPERTLPRRGREQILRSVLTGEEHDMPAELRRDRRWIAPLAAAAAVALIAVGAVALTNSGDGQQPAVQPDQRTVPLDRGPLSDTELMEMQLIDLPPANGPYYTFHYARHVDGPQGAVPVALASSPASNFLVVAVDDTEGAPLVPPVPTADRPIVAVDWTSEAAYPESSGYWIDGGFYRVADSVARVEVRLGTPDGPEPWRVAEPHGGYVYWAAWFEIAEYEPGTELKMEWRAYDTDGDPIDPELLPERSRTVRIPESSAR